MLHSFFRFDQNINDVLIEINDVRHLEHTIELTLGRWCLRSFYQESLRINHEKYCSKNEAIVRKYPSFDKDNVMLRYYDNLNLNIKKEIRRIFVIYADFELTIQGRYREHN